MSTNFSIPAIVLLHIAESIRRHIPDEQQRQALADDISLVFDADDAAAFVEMVGAE